MRIDCPWCGPQALNEFTYGGDASTPRPQNSHNNEDSQDASLAAWMDHVYLRANPAGPHREYWQHAAGCRAWLCATRDTLTHEIESVALVNPPADGDDQ